MIRGFAILFHQDFILDDLIAEYGIELTGDGRDAYGFFKTGIIDGVNAKMYARKRSDREFSANFFAFYGDFESVKRYYDKVEPKIQERNRRSPPPYATLGTIQEQTRI